VATSGKIASAIATVIQRMQTDGLTAANATARHAEAYSTPVVHVDRTGNIQISISVTTIDEDIEAALETYQARVEVVDTKLQIIQAWVPFDLIDTLAVQPFVLYIRPPSYAFRR
jgi:hypothetical protein